MENDINMYLLLSGGTKLIMNKIIWQSYSGLEMLLLCTLWTLTLYASATYKPKFACCSVKLNGEEKLVISPMPRLFH